MIYFLIVWYFIGLLPCLVVICQDRHISRFPFVVDLAIAILCALTGPWVAYRIWKTR